MPDMTAQCQSCRTRLTLPLPDAYQDEQGHMIDKDHMSQEENEAGLRDVMETLECPSCHQLGSMRVVGTSLGRPPGTFPVYLPYVLHLERYVEIAADSMADAEALVHQMVREGKIQRPSYTEGLDDWTEVTDLPNATSHFIIDGEAV